MSRKEINQKAGATRRASTQARNTEVVQEFRRLYEETRLRYDDCIECLSGTFYLTPVTIERIIKRG